MTKAITLESAINICNSRRRFKLHMVVLGDDGMFWVAIAAEAARLEKQGYEIAY